MYCNNKGCGKESEVLLNTNTEDVYCGECGETIQNVSHFTKTTLRTLGQIQRETKQQAFSVKCNSCQKNVVPKLNDKDQVFCSNCNTHLDYISKPYIQAIKFKNAK